VWQIKSGGKREPINLGKLNPRGLNFEWDVVDNPCLLKVISSNMSTAYFVYENRRYSEKSGLGTYEIEIAILDHEKQVYTATAILTITQKYRGGDLTLAWSNNYSLVKFS
jgi:hypothetical protein